MTRSRQTKLQVRPKFTLFLSIPNQNYWKTYLRSLSCTGMKLFPARVAQSANVHQPSRLMLSNPLQSSYFPPRTNVVHPSSKNDPTLIVPYAHQSSATNPNPRSRRAQSIHQWRGAAEQTQRRSFLLMVRAAAHALQVRKMCNAHQREQDGKEAPHTRPLLARKPVSKEYQRADREAKVTTLIP